MSYAILTTSNVASQSWQNVFTLINTITDPEAASRPSGITKWVFSAFPENRRTFPNYPLIVIESADIPNSFITPSKRTYNFSFDISIFSDTRSQIDTLTNSVIEKVAGTSLESYKMSLPKVNSASVDTMIINDQRIHRRTIRVEYMTVL